MSYEVRCPSCGHVARSPFVRMGAVIDCAECGQRYPIEESRVTRRTRRGDVATLHREPLVREGEAQAGEEELIRRNDDGHVIGLSGLSEMMRVEGRGGGEARHTSEENATNDEPIATGHTITPDDGVRSRQAARQSAGRRRARVVYTMIGGLVLTLAVMGGAIWYVMGRGGVRMHPRSPASVQTPLVKRTSPSPTPPNGHDHESPSPYAYVPVTTARPLAAAPWRRIKQPEYVMHRPSAGQKAWLVDMGRGVNQAANEFFSAEATLHSPQIATAATMHFVLVTTDNVAIRRTQAPLLLFGKGRRQEMDVTLPRDLDTQPLRVDAWLTIQTQAPGVYLTAGTHQLVARPAGLPLASPDGPTLLITAENLSDEPLSREVGLIKGADQSGHVIQRWRVDLTQPIKAGGMLRCRVLLPTQTEVEAFDQWQIDIAGQTTSK